MTVPKVWERLGTLKTIWGVHDVITIFIVMLRYYLVVSLILS